MLKIPKTRQSQPVLKDPERKCTICGQDYKAIAPLQKTCSKECREKKDRAYREEIIANRVPYIRKAPVPRNPDRVCTICGKDFKAVSAIQKTCSKECRAKKDRKHQKVFLAANPNCRKKYREAQLKKDPAYDRKKNDRGRVRIIAALGGVCVCPGCGVTNIYWLHIDYIPGMRGTGYRHPRHYRWVIDHITDFRLLCANHHYELTLTRKIDGTDITQ